MNREQRARLFAGVDLYAVTGAAQSVGRSTIEVVLALVAAGCRAIQLREKDLSKGELYWLAHKVRSLVPDDRLLLINDHLDVALDVGADGVHLGQDDLPLEAARRLAPELLIGASTHDPEQALAAQRHADYVNIGPIFATGTKRGVTPLGPQAISDIGPRLVVPFTVMGGINAGNLEQVLAQGARRVAVVSAVTAATDVRGAAETLRRRIRAARLT